MSVRWISATAIVVAVLVLAWSGQPLGGPEEPGPEPGGAVQPVPRGVPVLMYHHLAPAELGFHRHNPLVVPVEEFRWHLAWLAQEGWSAVSLQDLYSFLAGEQELPERSVVITFDDGYESVYHLGLPALGEFGFHAAVFVIGDRTAGSNPAFDPAVLSYLSLEQLERAHAGGLLEIGSHSFAGHYEDRHGPVLPRWSGRAVAADFRTLNSLLERAGLPLPLAVAYPYGAYGPDVLTAAGHAGYRLGFTIREGIAEPGLPLLELPRRFITPGLSRFQFLRLLEPDRSREPPASPEDDISLLPGPVTGG